MTAIAARRHSYTGQATASAGRGTAHSGPDLPKMLRNLKLDVIVIDMGYDESINVSSKNLGL